ncbi:MAG: carboxypeptidase-like regulatory domain-containing protein [Pyrinomonadaceae bacterium]
MRRVYLASLMLLSCLALPDATTAQSQPQHLGSISGRVFDSESKPAFQMEVRVMKADLVEADPEAIFAENRSFTYVNQDGSYELKYLAPGRYILAVNADHRFPYLVTYYPGINQVGNTAIVTVQQNQQTGKIDVLLNRPSLTQRVIEGTAIWEDGNPATNVLINLVLAKYPWMAPSSSLTDKDGRFKLYGFEHIKYLAKVADYTRDKKMRVEPVEVSPKVGMKPVRLVLRSP